LQDTSNDPPTDKKRFFTVKKLFCACFWILFIFTGCIEDNSSGQAYPVEDYFPMEVGNWWKYAEMETGDTLVRRITGCDTFEGQQYYEIFEGGSIEGLLSCYDGRIGWIDAAQPIVDSSDWEILLKEPIEAGEEWANGYGNSSVVIKNINAKMSIPAGVFDSCVTVRWKSSDLSLNTLGWDFAPGVGIVRWVKLTEAYEKKSEILLDYYIK
jgi:hypothetical protein